MSQQPTIHWLVSGVPQCNGFDGSGNEGVEIQSSFDPNILKLTCSICLARFHAEVSRG